MQVAEAESPDERLRLLYPAAPVAVHNHYPPAFYADLSARRQRCEVSIMVPTDGLDRGDAFELGEGLRCDDVAGVQDEVNATEHLENAIGQAVEKLRAMGVCDYPDSRRQEGPNGGCSRGINSTAIGKRKWCRKCPASPGIQDISR